MCVSGPSLSPRGWVVGGTALLCSVLVLHGVNQTTHLSCASCTRRYAGAFEAAGWDGATLLAAGEPELEALGIRSHIHRCVGVVLWLSIVRACVRACVLVCVRAGRHSSEQTGQAARGFVCLLCVRPCVRRAIQLMILSNWMGRVIIIRQVMALVSEWEATLATQTHALTESTEAVAIAIGRLVAQVGVWYGVAPTHRC